MGSDDPVLRHPAFDLNARAFLIQTRNDPSGPGHSVSKQALIQRICVTFGLSQGTLCIRTRRFRFDLDPVAGRSTAFPGPRLSFPGAAAI